MLALVPDAFGGYGGIALYNRDFLTALCEYPECTELVVLPRLMPNHPEPLPENLTHVVDGLNSKSGYLKTILKTVWSNSKFDLIVCGHINLLPLAFFVRLLTGAPVVLEVYGIEAWHPHQNHLVNILVKHVDAFVSISEVTRERFLGWANLSRTYGELLPNAIHLERYGMAPKNQKLLERYKLKDNKVLMTFGRLVSHERAKGFDEVLELLPELMKQYPDISYVIAGAGPDRERLESKAREFGVAGQVVFTGMVPKEEKADLFRLADVYVMPSRGEGFGFVFLEAMACGIPVIASKLDGSREAVLDGELGILVDPDSSEEIRDAICEMLGQEKSIPEGLSYFSFGNFKKRTHKIIDSILQNKKTSDG